MQKDFHSFGKDVEEEAFITDYFDIDLLENYEFDKEALEMFNEIKKKS